MPPDVIDTRDWVDMHREESWEDCTHAEDDLNCESRLWRSHDSEVPAGEWTRGDDAPTSIELPIDVEKFAVAHGIVHYLTVAIQLACRFFPQSPPKTEVEFDPDCNERWVSVGVTVSGEVEDVLRLEDRYTEAFLAEVPWPAREKIRLAYYFSDG